MFRVNENLSCRLFKESGFVFWRVGLVNDDITLEGGHQMITLDYWGEGGV